MEYEIQVCLELRGVLFRSQAEDGIRDSSVTGVQTYAVFFLRSEEHTSELQSHLNLVCRLLLEKKRLTFLIASLMTKELCIAFWQDGKSDSGTAYGSCVVLD